MSLKEWSEAFNKAQAAFPTIGKDKTAKIETKQGASFTYSYVGLASIIQAVGPVLQTHGLSVGQSVSGAAGSIAVETRIYHSSGHVEAFGPLVLAAGGDARTAGSAITYARRYALCAALGISPDEDDDGAAASKAPAREQAPAEPTHAVWLKDAVLIFKAWTDEQRREAYKQAMTDLGLDVLGSMGDAQKVFTKMTELYNGKDAPADDPERPFE